MYFKKHQQEANMYINAFGKHHQVFFNNEADYYEFLGYLAKNDGATRVVWEKNDQQGAWTAEGGIQFYTKPPAALRVNLNHTSGVGNIFSRVNCNDFVEHIVKHHYFISNGVQDILRIRGSIPMAQILNFDRGLAL